MFLPPHLQFSVYKNFSQEPASLVHSVKHSKWQSSCSASNCLPFQNFQASNTFTIVSYQRKNPQNYSCLHAPSGPMWLPGILREPARANAPASEIPSTNISRSCKVELWWEHHRSGPRRFLARPWCCNAAHWSKSSEEKDFLPKLE